VQLCKVWHLKSRFKPEMMPCIRVNMATNETNESKK